MNDDSSWRRLVDQLIDEVTALPAGARIPTQRALVDRFHVSASTVARAVDHLAARGLLETRPGAGTFRALTPATTPAPSTDWQDAVLGVGADGATPAARRRFDAAGLDAALLHRTSDTVDLASGYLHRDLQPADLLRRALTRASRRDDAWSRPAPVGVAGLRDWFATDSGAGATRHDVLVAGGGQGALALTMRAVCDPDDAVIVESPTYPGTLAAARAAGLRPVPVPLDAEGIDPALLDDALARTRSRLVVVQPAFHNPTGTTMGVERRREVLDVAARHRAFVVEDDFAHDLRHRDAGAAAPSLFALDPVGCVVRLRSLTKATSPNLRVAGLVARGPVAARLRAAHAIETMFVPAALQLTALELLDDPAWGRAHRVLVSALTLRRTTLAAAVRDAWGAGALAHEPRGGYHLWLRLPEGVSDRDALAAAARAGVALTAGSDYHADRDTTEHVRLSHVAAPGTADLVAGVERVAAALAASS